MNDIIFAAYLPAKDHITRPFARIVYDKRPTPDQVRTIGNRLVEFLSDYPIEVKDGAEVKVKKEPQESVAIEVDIGEHRQLANAYLVRSKSKIKNNPQYGRPNFRVVQSDTPQDIGLVHIFASPHCEFDDATLEAFAATIKPKEKES